MSVSTSDEAAVREVLAAYCDGLYDGDVAMLRGAFHPDAMLYGIVRGERIARGVDAYLGIVAARRSPRARGEAHGMTVHEVELAGPMARARVRCRMLGFDYTDYLTLLCWEGRWAIASKVYVEVMQP